MVAAASPFLRPGTIRVPGPSDRHAASQPALHLPSPRSPSPAAVATAAAAAYTHVSTPPRPAPTLYDVLGLPASATADEIKSAYRRLARSCHPDVRASGGGAAAEEFMRVHAAYSTLSDPDKRADYDRRLPLRRSRSMPMSGHGRAYAGPGAGTGGSFSGLRRRTWETDQCW